jgi:hypothetical protein
MLIVILACGMAGCLRVGLRIARRLVLVDTDSLMVIPGRDVLR